MVKKQFFSSQESVKVDGNETSFRTNAKMPF